MDEDMTSTVDVVTFVDDDGNEFDMEVVQDFEHKEKKYVVLAEFVDHEHCDDPECACHDEDEEPLYIFEVQKGDDGEDEFIAIDDDDLLEELSEVVEGLLFEEEGDE